MADSFDRNCCYNRKENDGKEKVCEWTGKEDDELSPGTYGKERTLTCGVYLLTSV